MLKENQALHQVAGFALENESLSNQLQQADAARQLSDTIMELARFRAKVGTTRDKTDEARKLVEENRRLRIESEIAKHQAVETGAFVERRQEIMSAAQTVGLAFRMYARDNDSQYPTSLEQIQNYIGNATNLNGGISLESFEMVNVEKVNNSFPEAVALREQTPRLSPLGGWEREYLLVDGSVQTATSADGNFDAWEQTNFVNSFSSPGQ